LVTKVSHEGIPPLAPAGGFFRQRIVNFMLGGCQFILGYAEFVIRFPLTTVLAWNVIMPRTRLRLLVS
jgi:hypothetical protein